MGLVMEASRGIVIPIVSLMQHRRMLSMVGKRGDGGRAGSISSSADVRS
jgi:hypothetical protein